MQIVINEGKRTILITRDEVMGKLISLQQDLRDIQGGIVQQWETMDPRADVKLFQGIHEALIALDRARVDITDTTTALREGGYAQGQDIRDGRPTA
jgi:hypothetical protein